MMTTSCDVALRGSVARRLAEAEGRRASNTLIIGTVAFCLVAVTDFSPGTARAEEAFGSAIADEELVDVRGGDNDTTTNSHNTILTSGSEQNTDANNQDNSIGGNAGAGNFTLGSGALANNHGMTNVVVNTAPQSNAQGIMTLNLVLH